jgi:CheY-like chemotaxis protein
MGGAIRMDSEPGRGTRVYVTLPFEIRAALVAPGHQGTLPDLRGRDVLVVDSNATNRPIVSEAPRSLRILVAEDNPVNRTLVTAILTKRGHTVVAAINGLEAVAAAARDAFDVILMDVQMPEMDGLDATAAIRKSEEGTALHVIIIALTAHAMKGDREICIAAGMDEYLTKPINAKELFALLESLSGIPVPPENTAA